MQYYAKTYTADPKTGLITPGELLTETQVDALGEDRIADMVERGVLGVTGGKPAQTEAPAKSEKPTEKREKKPAKAVEEADTEAGDAEDPADADEDDGTEGEEDGDEMPEIDAADLIGEDEEPAAQPAKKGGRRKAK